jgi:acetyltransferase
VEVSVVSAAEVDSREFFDALLRPRSVALIGASTNPEALGGRPLGFMASYGYAGAIYPVNVKADIVQGLMAYRSIADVPHPVDLAMVAVRAKLVPGILRECAEAGVKVAVVMSSGFGEGMGVGAELVDELRRELGRTSMRILGPNCEGLASLPASAPMTFSPVLDIRRTGSVLKRGSIAIVSQSGGLGFAMAGWGSEVGLGYSYILTTGNELDVDSLELAAHFVDDPETDCLVLVIEGLRDLSEFVRIADLFREAGKHLVVVKLGRFEAGVRGALAHTSQEAGGFELFADLFQSHGVLHAADMDELIDVLQAVTKVPRLAGVRAGIITTSGGAGVWLADACESVGFTVPTLSAPTAQRLKARMPDYGSPTNPVDLTAQFLAGGSFIAPMRDLIESGEIDLLILATSLSSSGRLAADREALGQLVASSPIPIAVYTYTKPAASCVEILNELGVPWFTTSTRTARSLAALIAKESHDDR